jgi:uncharacterized protein YcbX
MQVTRLSVTPIKGLALDHPQSIEVTATGPVGDRAFYLVDASDRLTSISKTGSLVGVSAAWDDSGQLLTLSDAAGNVLISEQISLGAPNVADFFGFRKARGRVVDGAWGQVFSDLAGQPLRLVKADEANGGRDVEPLTLLGNASLAELARQSGLDHVDGRRFRMLIQFDGAAPHEEDSWDGRTLTVGSAVIMGGGPVQRCAGTTRNPLTGEVDLRTLTLIGGYRGRQESIFGAGFNFGVYASTVAPGRVSVGDTLVLGPASAGGV